MRRLAPLLVVLAFAAGCSTSKPGEKTVLPLPQTVVGTVPKAAKTVIPAVYENGDANAGKQVFETAGCSGCHTLKDAGATGTVGPNLDQLKPPLSKVITQVVNGGPIMPAFKGKISPKQIADVSAYVVKASGGNPAG